MAQTKRRLVEGRNYLQKESEPPRSGPSIGSILLFESSLPSSAVRTLQLMPRSHPKRVGASSRMGHMLVATSDPSKRQMFGQKQCIWCVFAVLIFVVKGPPSPT